MHSGSNNLRLQKYLQNYQSTFWHFLCITPYLILEGTQLSILWKIRQLRYNVLHLNQTARMVLILVWTSLDNRGIYLTAELPSFGWGRVLASNEGKWCGGCKFWTKTISVGEKCAESQLTSHTVPKQRRFNNLRT